MIINVIYNLTCVSYKTYFKIVLIPHNERPLYLITVFDAILTGGQSI